MFSREPRRGRNIDAEIVVMSADGLGQKALTNNSADDSAPAWSPDGQRIAFASDQASGANREIFIMNADGSEQKKLIAGERTTSDFSPDWSPDGTRIAFTSLSAGSRWDLLVANADGSGRATSLVSRTGEQLTWPDWSPDGSKIAFNTGAESSHGDIFVINADGSGLRRLTDSPANDFDPTWSPGGSKIAFISDRLRGPGWPEVFVMNADGGSQTSLSRHAYGFAPTWSPDGSMIANATGARVGGGNSQIVAYQTDGSGRINLSGNSYHDYPDDDSPDWHGASIQRQCVVPRVVGHTLRRAGVKIRSASCVVGRLHRARSPARRGRIIRQTPRPGVRRPHAATVNLIVSRGKRR